MNERNDRQDDIADRRVSKAYRALSDEHVPVALDREILKQAALATEKERNARNMWLRPLAFAATLFLGIALLFDMQASLRPASIPHEPDEAAVQPAIGKDERRHASSPAQPGELGREPARESRKSSLADSSSPESTGSRQLKKLRHPRPTAPETALSAPANTPADSGRCKRDETATADAWWQCIKTLREAGKTAEAAEEQRRLDARYPEFRIDR